ncbi:MAG: SCP2 sterol-binding domain-containing protein [Anaerolineae bacterium]|jgi:putative sterol carrier protein|nr:SCP2 sterol-binding domain-containing protein [Anaerolineae bacterium]MDH7473658.1 SCP2 sterol-binding domain-containing protein [Anaerolineae bacterium]
MKLGSPEYLEEVKRRSNADATYCEMIKDEHESYTLVIQAEPKKGVNETLTIGFQVDHGQIPEIWIGERPTTFTLAGPYGVWVDILRGVLGPNKAFTMRKLKIKGNFLQLLKGADSTIRWVEILRTIPTEFEGEYAQYNFEGQELI